MVQVSVKISVEELLRVISAMRVGEKVQLVSEHRQPIGDVQRISTLPQTAAQPKPKTTQRQRMASRPWRVPACV